MPDIFLFLIIAIFGIIGYRLMGLVDRFIDRHAAGSKQELETNEYEPAENGEPEHAGSGLPVFLHFQR